MTPGTHFGFPEDVFDALLSPKYAKNMIFRRIFEVKSDQNDSFLVENASWMILTRLLWLAYRRSPCFFRSKMGVINLNKINYYVFVLVLITIIIIILKTSYL